MKRWSACLVYALVAVPAADGAADDRAIELGARYSLHSALLNESREYWVSVPRSYKDDTYTQQKYPVLYLLDGETLFHSVSGLVRFLSDGANRSWPIPELIVVGIVNVDRTRDLSPTHSTMTLSGNESAAFEGSGGGSRFLEFLESELMPRIEADFRTTPHRTLVGHSFGGLSAVYCLLERPRLFQAYISIDPALWWDDRYVLRRIRQSPKERVPRRARMFISAAGKDVSMGPFDRRPVWDKSFAELNELMTPWTDSGFEYRLQWYPEEDHGSVPLISVHDGLRWLFREYHLNYADLYQGPEHIAAHFERVSKALGYTMSPPERMIDQYASFLLHRMGDENAAIALHQLITNIYPRSAHAHERMGDTYVASGRSADAAESYRRALSLDPDNDRLAEKAQAPIEP